MCTVTVGRDWSKGLQVMVVGGGGTSVYYDSGRGLGSGFPGSNGVGGGLICDYAVAWYVCTSLYSPYKLLAAKSKTSKVNLWCMYKVLNKWNLVVEVNSSLMCAMSII